LDDESFSHPSERLPGGTIGKHVRHCLDHFLAALSVHDERGNAADYDHRERNVPMETDRAEALEAIHRVARRLRAVRAVVADEPAVVRVMVTCDGAQCEFRSTVGRELAFAAHHAVHHHAMMKVIADELAVSSPAGFGLAPSTELYQRSVAPVGAQRCSGKGGN
jgi:uncharacterized damage-inducible protein DinB